MATDEQNKQTVLSTLPKDLPLDFLKTITDQFSKELIIGESAFGTVYKGTLPDGQMISVKKLLENTPVPRDKVFKNEVLNIMALQHENIVKLLGYCNEGQRKVVLNNGRYIVADVFEILLCYEYLTMGSLHKNLFGTETTRSLSSSAGPNNMTWDVRFKIIKGICNGLLFLHKIPIIHMDLKPENIWLDHNMIPKIADFGLSRLFGQEKTRENTQNVVGSLGYIAPEYLYRGEISTQSDIYSLGLLIIETTTGQKNKPKQNEPSAREFIKEVVQNWTNEHIASIYSKLSANDLQEVRVCIEIGLECVQIEPKKRPYIENIVERLNGLCANKMANQVTTGSRRA